MISTIPCAYRMLRILHTSMLLYNYMYDGPPSKHTYQKSPIKTNTIFTTINKVLSQYSHLPQLWIGLESHDSNRLGALANMGQKWILHLCQHEPIVET